MPLSSQRQRFSIFVSPRNEDFLFYEKVDKQRVQESIPKYGDSHPDHRKYPNHFFAKAVQADEEGQVYYYYYAAKRENQDDYNWEHTTVDHKSATYDQVERTYVTLRSEYDEDSPTLGSAMPLTDSDPFDAADNYVLIRREQARVGESSQQSRKSGATEIDSMFVIERRVYLKRVPITTTAYDKNTGAHVFTTTNLVHRDEIISTKGADAQELFYLRPDNLSYYYQPDSVSRYAVYGATSGVTGFTVAELLADSENLFWEVDEETGSHQTVDQVSEEWFYVSAVQNGEANERRVFVYLTPDQKDYLFYELIDRKNEKAEPANLPAFGDIHPEFTKHKFVAATPNDSTGDFYRYYYASDRLTQNSYNWMHATTDLGGTKYATVEREYITPRTSYSESSPALASPMPVTAEDPFSNSDQYILLNRQKQPLPSSVSELESVYIREVRTYIKRTPLTQTSYNESTGYHTFRQTEIVHTSEAPSGQTNTISYLVDNTGDDFWSVDADTGAHKVVDQLSSEWYAVTAIFDGEKNDRRVFTYVSPDQNDFIFYELVDRKNEKEEPEDLPAYGESHPLYTTHKFVAATPADSAGDFYRYYYAAPRLNQDSYNWNFTSTNIGGNRYDAVERSSIVERSAYLDETPAQASPMPISDSDPFSSADNYVLVSREKRDLSGDLSELSSVFVLDVRTYIQRSPITTANYSESTGYHTFSITDLWYKNEVPTEQTRTISTLVEDTSDPFWEVDELTGEHRNVQQLSSDWYAVTSVFIGEASDRRVFTYVSPDQNDFIFYELIDRKNEKAEPTNLPSYGASHPFLRRHQFVAAMPDDKNGDFYRYYYAAPRSNQSAYNWEHSTADLGGQKFDIVTSTSVIPRLDYSSTSEPSPPSKFSGYVYMSKSQSQVSGSDSVLNSVFVVEKVQYIRKVTITSQTYDNELGTTLTSEVELYRVGEQPTASGLDASGFVTELRQLSADWVAVERKQIINVGTGAKIREFITTENTSWPAVLETFRTNAWAKRDGSYRYLVYPDYKRYGYSGPTSVKVEQFWQPVPFTGIGPDAPMIPLPIEVQTPIGVVYQSIPTLHGAQRIQGTTGNQDPTWEYLTWDVQFPATEPADWPDQIVVSDDQRPYRGGYIRQKMTAYRPSTTGTGGYTSDGGIAGGPTLEIEDTYNESTGTYTVEYTVTSLLSGFTVTKRENIPQADYLSGVRPVDGVVEKWANEEAVPTPPQSVIDAATVGLNIQGPFAWANANDSYVALRGNQIQAPNSQGQRRDISDSGSGNEGDSYFYRNATYPLDRRQDWHDAGTVLGVHSQNGNSNISYGDTTRPIRDQDINSQNLTPRPISQLTEIPNNEARDNTYTVNLDSTYSKRVRYDTFSNIRKSELSEIPYRFEQAYNNTLPTDPNLSPRGDQLNPFVQVNSDRRTYSRYTFTSESSSQLAPATTYYNAETKDYFGGTTYTVYSYGYTDEYVIPLRLNRFSIVTPNINASGLAFEDLVVYAVGTTELAWVNPVTSDPIVYHNVLSGQWYQLLQVAGMGANDQKNYADRTDFLTEQEAAGKITKRLIYLSASYTPEQIQAEPDKYGPNAKHPSYVRLYESVMEYEGESNYIFLRNRQNKIRFVPWEETQASFG